MRELVGLSWDVDPSRDPGRATGAGNNGVSIGRIVALREHAYAWLNADFCDVLSSRFGEALPSWPATFFPGEDYSG